MSALDSASASTGPSRYVSLEAVSEQAVDAALLAADQGVKAADDVRRAVARELEEARYVASLAERRYEHVDPAKLHVARKPWV